MAVTAGEGISTAEIPQPNTVVLGSVDFKGRPSVRSKSGSWKSAWSMAVFEMGERFCCYGISSHLMSYLTDEMDLSTASAASNLDAWYGTASLLPVLGAVLADSFFGRFRMIVASSLLYILGLGFLVLSSALNSSSSTICKNTTNNTSCTPSQLQTIFFFASLYIIAFSQGGHRPCLQAFGADRFDIRDANECIAKSSFFNWWYWFTCLGIVLALSVVNYIQENLSWEIGFGIPAVIMCLSLALFCIGSFSYRFNAEKNGRHPFLRLFRVLVNAAKKKEADHADRDDRPCFSSSFNAFSPI